MGVNRTYTCDLCKRTENHPGNFIIIFVSGRCAWIDGEVNNVHGDLIDEEIYLCVSCYHKFVDELNTRFLKNEN